MRASSSSSSAMDGRYESNFIHAIGEVISVEAKEPTYLDLPKCPVGLDSRVQEMLKILDVGGSDIRMVGIWGFGGIGKTTIAKAVYKSIAHKFEGSCFLANVREGSEVDGGLLNLQKNILSEIVGSEELKEINVDEGITTLLSERLRHKKILLVLDDVNKSDQLEKLAGASNWFGLGSRIIITTRDKHLLFVHQINPIYKVKELDPQEARDLFISKAFKNKTDLDDDEKLSVSSVVAYAQGLPLALVVLGSRLCGTSIHNWQAILDGYKRSPLQDIQTILRISYDALEIPEKEVFLDIACFFKHRNKNDVIQILEGCGRINPEHSIQVLEQKGLINVEYGYICMHDLLEEVGKAIVCAESPRRPSKRSRLWFHEDVVEVLTKNTGTSKVEGIMVQLPTQNEICLSPKCFKKMENLKFIINVNARFCGTIDYPPEQLRFVLNWPEYPLQSLPSNFEEAKTGTSQAESIMVKLPTVNEIRLSPKCFKKMKNLKFIINVDNARFCGTIDHPPEQLRFVLDWPEYPLQSLPSNFEEANTETNKPLEAKIDMPKPDEIPSTAESFSKASSTEWTFLCIALCLEIMSLCFDQLASPSKPIYALFGMLLAIAALLNCICEIIHKGIKEGLVLFGTLPDFYGLVAGIFQCICSAIQYVYFIRHDQNPIKVSLLPTIFVICQTVSRLNRNRRDETIEQKD